MKNLSLHKNLIFQKHFRYRTNNQHKNYLKCLCYYYHNLLRCSCHHHFYQWNQYYFHYYYSFSFLEDELVPGKSVELEVVGLTCFIIGVEVVVVVFDFLVSCYHKIFFFSCNGVSNFYLYFPYYIYV